MDELKENYGEEVAEEVSETIQECIEDSEFNENPNKCVREHTWKYILKRCSERPEYVSEAIKSIMYGFVGASALSCIGATKRLMKAETRFKNLWVKNEIEYQKSLKKK